MSALIGHVKGGKRGNALTNTLDKLLVLEKDGTQEAQTRAQGEKAHTHTQVPVQASNSTHGLRHQRTDVAARIG